MNKVTLYWQCPNCETLNKWVDETCAECLFSIDKVIGKSIVHGEFDELKQRILNISRR